MLGAHVSLFASAAFSLSDRTPQVVFEVVLLDYLLGLAARAGVTMTAFHAIYHAIWGESVDRCCHSQREHFVQKFFLGMLVWSSLHLLQDANVAFCTVPWTLRPHHVASDLENILPLVRHAFQTLASAYACWLFRSLPAVIVDGKWSVQTLVCNCRNCNPKFVKDLQLGYMQGCCNRPAKGAKYCSQHAMTPLPTASSADILITEHRQAPLGSSSCPVHLSSQTAQDIHGSSKLIIYIHIY